jgi:hypothetical protein
MVRLLRLDVVSQDHGPRPPSKQNRLSVGGTEVSMTVTNGYRYRGDGVLKDSPPGNVGP